MPIVTWEEGCRGTIILRDGSRAPSCDVDIPGLVRAQNKDSAGASMVKGKFYPRPYDVFNIFGELSHR